MNFKTIEFFNYLSTKEINEGKGAYWKDGQIHMVNAETSADVAIFAHSEETIDTELRQADLFAKNISVDRVVVPFAFINHHEIKD